MSLLTEDERGQWNKIARSFGAMGSRDMRGSSTGKLSSRIKNRNKTRDGLVEAVGFVFPRYGVFYEMGVFGGLTRDEARAQGKLDPHPWFNPAVDKHMPKLEKAMGQLLEDFSINAMQLKIKHTD